ncbi:MAG TPA: DUF5683 domain-containing protein [Patescibacteria group bacterium]|nr:DUF5683 domain-containing protein [Patescibacteria group bacterium]
MLFKKLIALTLFLTPAPLFAQTEQDTVSRMVRVVDSTQTTLDTLSPTPLSEIVRQTSPSQSEFQLTKSPTGAVLRSLAFPGWGQWYVGDKWKTPVFAAAWGSIVYLIVQNHVNYSDRNDQYQAARAIGTPNTELLRRQREVFRDNRDRAAFVLAGVYIISAVDAYVGAHLYDFNVDDDLSFGFNHSSTGAVMLNYSIRF